MPAAEPKTTPTQFRLAPETTAALDRIAAHLSAETGTPMNRTDALRFAVLETAKKISKKSVK